MFKCEMFGSVEVKCTHGNISFWCKECASEDGTKFLKIKIAEVKEMTKRLKEIGVL